MRSALMVVIAVGVALRLWQYAANTSLWFDEIALADGILTLDLWNLLTAPLPYNQVAPRGFLLAEKFVVAALGPSDYALRLFPLVCSLVSLVVFARLVTRMLDGVGPLAAVVLFATAAPFIACGALVKQYSTDVCVAVVLWWVVYELISQPVTRYRAGWAALLGSILIWFSHPGVLMVT
ncbi:MAG: glycosyltransferase family 39 protein, partial [Rubrivivax sp.]|nr:glycosyltransferase family 39 protein [Pyrinomonadaceae bacterium]